MRGASPCWRPRRCENYLEGCVVRVHFAAHQGPRVVHVPSVPQDGVVCRRGLFKRGRFGLRRLIPPACLHQRAPYLEGVHHGALVVHVQAPGAQH
eukprot:scaffold4396_cov196-Pinguiococcus_pyrenoidosus.AAC.9